MTGFQWTKTRDKAARLLAEGYTQVEVAKKLGISDRTVRRWWADMEFRTEVDRLTHMVGIAMRSERLRIAMRVIRGRTDLTSIPRSDRDLLDWLKYAQGETDGVRLDLAELLTALTSSGDAGDVAGGGSGSVSDGQNGGE